MSTAAADHDPDELPPEVDFERMPPSTAVTLADLADMYLHGTMGLDQAAFDFLDQHEGMPWMHFVDELGREERRRAKEERTTGFVPFKGEEERVAHHNKRDPLGGTLTIRQWRALRDAFEGRCAYCGCEPGSPVLEHVRALSLGGETSVDNVLPACGPCNKDKGTKTLEEWQTTEGWWLDFIGRLAEATPRFERAMRPRKARRA